MTFVSHAQNFEDVRLWRAFSDILEGRYLDIGTQEPVRDSVSLAFYERGWRGVHVEPTPTYAAAMRLARPDETVIEAAVSNAPGPIQFFEIPETGLSTGIGEIADQHAKAGLEHRMIAVPTVTLAGLFDLMGDAPIHWLKIDVEGMEADVLSSWGNHPARPAALVIEATMPNTQIETHDSWYNLVLSRGYRDVLFDGLSRYFIHEAHAERGPAMALSPNIFDGFVVESSHFAASRLVQERDAALEASRQQAEAERQETLAAMRNQAEAERLAEVTALQHQLEAEHDDAITIITAQAEAGRLAMLAAMQEEATAKQLEAVEQARAQAEAERLDALVAAQARGQAELDEAVATARAEAAAALDAARIALEARIAAGEHTLAQAQQELAKQHGEKVSLAREAGKLQGWLAAQTETYTGRLRDAEAVRRNLAARLTASERALGAARISAADLREELQRLTSEHARSLARLDNLHQAAEANAAQLSEKLSAISQQLTEGEAQAAADLAERERLQRQLASRETQLVRARELFDAAPDPLAGWPRSLATLLARFAQQQPKIVAADHAARLAAWRAETLAAELFRSKDHEFRLASGASMSDLAAAEKGFSMIVGEGPITSVQQLLAPHDVEFVSAAYEAVLGRAPDPEGGAYYLSRLRSGVHKLEILKQLRRSSEGREFIPGVAGLDRAIRRHRRVNLPLVGWLLRALIGGESDRGSSRQIRAVSNEVGALTAKLAGQHELDPSSQQQLYRPEGRTSKPQQAQANPAKAFTVDASVSYDIEEFMQLYDTDFVNQLYACILKREPDPCGMRHYLNRLRRGISKIQIIHDIRRSEEGESIGINITGLRRAYAAETVLSIPIVGSILSFSVFCFSIRNHFQDLRNIENQIHRLSIEMEDLKSGSRDRSSF